MWLRKRVKALELNADCSKGMHDHLSGEIEKLAGMVDDLFTQGDLFAELVKGLDARADGLYAGIRRNEQLSVFTGKTGKRSRAPLTKRA